MPMEEGAFVHPKKVPQINSILRYDNRTKSLGSYSLLTNQWIGNIDQCIEGRDIAEAVRIYQKSGWFQRFTFDNQVLSLMYNWLDHSIATRFRNHIVSVKDKSELQAIEDSMFKTDWVVKTIEERNCAKINVGSLSSDEENVELMKNYGYVISKREYKRRIASINEASVAVELLFSLKQLGTLLQGQKNVPSVDSLEAWVRNRARGLILYEKDAVKNEGLQGQSAETQLKERSWDIADLQNLLIHWQQISKGDVTKTNIFMMATGTAAFLVGVILSKY